MEIVELKSAITHFTNPKINLKVYSNLDRFFYIVWSVVLIVEYFNETLEIFLRILLVAIFVFILMAAYGWVIRKAIHRVEIHWEESKLHLIFYKAREIKSFNFYEINSITVNGAIYFRINNKVKILSTTRYNEILPYLARIIEIKWGRYCDFLGPKMEDRVELMKLMVKNI